MNIRWLMLALAGVLLAGCETYQAPRYGVSVDNVMALKTLGPAKVKVGEFAEPKQFGAGCRAAGPITAADQLTFAGYIRKALADELKLAGLYDDGAGISLTGAVDNLAFSSSVGFWDIALTVTSSNGKTISVKEHYEFPSAFTAVAACKRVSDALFPAVQNVIQKVVSSLEFRAMIKG